LFELLLVAKKITLVTNFSEEDKTHDPKTKLGEIKSSLVEYGITLEILENPNLHDREIRLDNGWTVKIGRGLDIYQKAKSNFSIGYYDFELRHTLETTVEIFKRN